ncbi:hypothetical protein GCM10010483_47800 [Actinokineospora diospyrosa]
MRAFGECWGLGARLWGWTGCREGSGVEALRGRLGRALGKRWGLGSRVRAGCWLLRDESRVEALGERWRVARAGGPGVVVCATRWCLGCALSQHRGLRVRAA